MTRRNAIPNTCLDSALTFGDGAMDTSAPNFQSLATRVQKLEGQKRLYKCGGSVLFLAAAIGIVVGRGQPIVNVEAQTQPSQKSEPMLTFRGGTGSTLLPQCQAAVKVRNGKGGTHALKLSDMQDAVDGSFCTGYVLGVIDTFTVTNTLTDAGRTVKACIPDNANTDQLNRVVAKYLNDNPATLNKPAGLLVVESMVDAFPCK